MKYSRLRAQVAPYIDAIKKTRKEGATWGEIGELLGMTDKQVRLAVKFCKYEVEQIPLPLPEPPPAPAAAVAGHKVTPGPRPIGQPSNKDFLASLPQIGGKK